MSEDYIEPVTGRWHVAYGDRVGIISQDRREAVRIAEQTGAAFVQELDGARRIVWEAV